jgi:hypothetical protein
MFLILIVLVLCIPILAILMDSSIAKAIANRIDRRDLTEPDRLYSERIRYLESEVERLSNDVTRLQDESQFVQKLLTGEPSRSLEEPDSDG